MSESHKRYVSEFLGTFGLVFFGAGAAITDSMYSNSLGTLGIAMVFGLIVLAMVYSFGEISGAHINPAVSLAFWLTGRFPLKDLLPYITTQCLGAICATGVLKVVFQNPEFLGETLPHVGIWPSFLLEVVLSFFLMLVILNVSTGSKEIGIMAGIAIGSIVALEAAMAGPLSGASMNPARSLGPALISGNWTSLWIYLIAPFVGASLAVPWCRLSKGKDCCTQPK